LGHEFSQPIDVLILALQGLGEIGNLPPQFLLIRRQEGAGRVGMHGLQLVGEAV
jgi:hypothetical protein